MRWRRQPRSGNGQVGQAWNRGLSPLTPGFSHRAICLQTVHKLQEHCLVWTASLEQTGQLGRGAFAVSFSLPSLRFSGNKLSGSFGYFAECLLLFSSLHCSVWNFIFKRMRWLPIAGKGLKYRASVTRFTFYWVVNVKWLPFLPRCLPMTRSHWRAFE